MDGIAAIYTTDEKAKKSIVHDVFLATGMCQHRGKASAGMAIGNSKGIHIYKDLGRIGDVIDSDIMQAYQDLEPVVAIGNVGYTKSKIPSKNNAEPIRIIPKKPSKIDIVLTMDGYLVKEDDLKEELSKDYYFETNNKTEIIGALLHKYILESGISFEAGKKLIDKLHGRATFALVALVYDSRETCLITLNDDKAFEPFCYSLENEKFVASSESVSQQRLGMKKIKEFQGAEMSLCSFSNGLEIKRLRIEPPLQDKFQPVYFGNVSSIHNGKEIFQYRRELGLALSAKCKPSEANLVIPNPESGWGVSYGIAEGLNLPLAPVLVKLAQAVRTFQEAERRKRTTEVGLKFSAVQSMLKDKHIIMGDDSIVKGSVGEGGSIKAVFDCEAKCLEFWISYAPMLFPSFKEWHRGPECINELAVRRAFESSTPYGKSIEEIEKAVTELIVKRLKKVLDKDYRFRVRYNSPDTIKKILGPGSYQALDASYPIDEQFWPPWLKEEVERFRTLTLDKFI